MASLIAGVSIVGQKAAYIAPTAATESVQPITARRSSQSALAVIERTTTSGAPGTGSSASRTRTSTTSIAFRRLGRSLVVLDEDLLEIGLLREQAERGVRAGDLDQGVGRAE